MPLNPSELDPVTSPLRSVHTTNFPVILSQLGISLAVSTYQAGKVILVRAVDDTLNTHFRLFNRPMGLAGNQEKLAIGTAFQIIDLRNVPDAAAKLEPAGKHDACYLPRQIHMTGDIDIHEMAWAGDELWFINTRFSCLCTLGHPNSFVPRWRPPFVTAYDLTDRCHLNGLGLRDGKPKYVTALGETDTPAGWRQNKVNGGILMEIDTNEILVRGISMPHSPRWHSNQLWVLESGKGYLSTVDSNQGQLTSVTQLPGFTRGIDFWGDLAFIGLSQVRETAVFSGLEIAQHPERICGIWVVNLQTGEILAFLRFEAGIQEIFAITILPNLRFPEIIEWDENLLSSTYVLPDVALAQIVKPTAENIAAEQHFILGNHLHTQGKLHEAVVQYRNCLTLKPDFLRAQYNLGVVLGDLDQYPEAIELLNQVIAIEPHHAEAHNSLGYVYSKQRIVEKAIEHYTKAVRLDGSYAKAHFNLGMNLLQVGEFEQGWAESEWRWKTAEFTPFQCPQPLWRGEDISDKTLLVHTEQGAGDAIQFSRYLPIVAKRCQRLILVCTPSLIELFKTVEGIDQILNAGTLGLREFDVYIPLMSLPFVFKTTLDTIPAEVPYLSVPQTQNQLEILRLNQSSTTFKVGIVWAGSPTHKNDANRSCQLTDFLPILQLTTQIPNLEFYSLQKGDRALDLHQLSPETSVHNSVHNLDSVLETYADTAAIIQQLDLVISVDTSVVHLAGALAKPVWTLLCYNPDWRWLLDRSDTPWYPTMRLFHQPQPGDWQSVFQQLRQELAQQLEGGLPPIQPPAPTSRQLGITWPIALQSGWGTYGLNLTLELCRANWKPVLLAPVANWETLQPTHQFQLQSLLHSSPTRQVPLDPSGEKALNLDFPVLCALGNQFNTAEEIATLSSPKKIGLIFFEETQITPAAIERAKQYPLIVTGSTWNQQILQHQGITHSVKVFQGIDPTLFHPAPKSGLFGDRFVIFSGGKLEYRKGQDIVVAAFRAFQQRHSDALLVTAWYNHWPQFMVGLEQAGHVVGVPQINSNGSLRLKEWLVRNGISAAAVVTLDALPNAQMPQFLREADVALFTNRAEGGTNLVAMESLACGIPTILSANTGHLDLLGEHCYGLHDQTLVESSALTFGTEGWGESAVDEVVEVLEQVYQNRSDANHRGQHGAEWMQRWSWKHQVQQLLQSLSE
ncbi:MAG: TIGR03032 family protein [Microcoleaceae cyanobacterium]